MAVFGLYVGAIFGHTAVAINRQKQTMWIYISDAVITLIGYLIFIPKYGMYGAAWMTVFSEVYAGVLLWLTIRHYSKESLQLKTFGKIVLASLVMGVSLFFFHGLPVLLSVAIGIAIYIMLLTILRAISKQTLREILPFKQD